MRKNTQITITRKFTMRTIYYALKETASGYQLGEVSIEDTNYGGRRKYFSSIDLFYKRLNFAEQKAHSFFHRLYRNWKNTTLIYYGVIKSNEFSGELASANEKPF